MKDRLSFSIFQDGMKVASGVGPAKQAQVACDHYAAIYGRDGPVTVRTRRITVRTRRLPAHKEPTR